ncbi:Uncharacterised protein [Vibrio cholerae]|uniref:Uncharacterized protein n=1 Tax=Vibrio cholerae TaxID=666 RepID=A0A655X5J3_VIBCL|nr:Uncharacterised protein [Vibrio cholerae]CSC05969.1 Uncharacterised protein [Vibrio cholerae]
MAVRFSSPVNGSVKAKTLWCVASLCKIKLTSPTQLNVNKINANWMRLR